MFVEPRNNEGSTLKTNKCLVVTAVDSYRRRKMGHYFRAIAEGAAKTTLFSISIGRRCEHVQNTPQRDITGLSYAESVVG